MNFITEPMQASFLGGWEIILIFATICVILLPFAALAAIIYLILNRGKLRPDFSVLEPAKPMPQAPITPEAGKNPADPGKTQVIPRKCPQCGTALQADAPEGLCPACLLQRGFATEVGGGATQSQFVPPAIAELAKLFPQLEILECLGRGGMGAVYKARQPLLDRFVALKILAPEKQNDPQFAERFGREARVLAKLSHPNIVSVFDFGEVQGRFYLIMEYVDGLTLRQVMQAGKISSAEALDLVPKICEALQYAHGQGIVHRDIKPENILLDKQGRLKIADFGIAKIAGVDGGALSLTSARDVMGTPVYMAPEQVEKPQSVDHRADIYSLGVVFYEMLTGELPLGKFQAPSKKVHVDVRLDEVVLHALEKEPSRRYQQASQVKTAVEGIAGSPPQMGAVSEAAIAAPANINVSDKIILPAFLLAFFFGPFGAHRFYVGKYGTAILQLCTCGGMGIWATIDWILLACGVFTDANGRRMKNWIYPKPGLPQPVTQNPPVGNVAGGAAPQPNLFWRRFAMVVAGIILFVVVAIIALMIWAVAFVGNHVNATNPESARVRTPEELKADGVVEENGEFWKKSTQSIPLDANGRFDIGNVSGKIQVDGWSSNLVVMEAAIHGKDANSVDTTTLHVDTRPDSVSIYTKRPQDANFFDLAWLWNHHGFWSQPTEDFIVHVPTGVHSATVNTVNGTVRVRGVAGDIDVSSVNGQVDVEKAAHNLKLSTVNGTAHASMERLGAGQSVSFSAVNGEFDLTLPEDADGQFSVTTVNGYIASDFSSLKPKRELVGNNLKGSLGNGDAKVKVDAVNGTVKFLKKSQGETNQDL